MTERTPGPWELGLGPISGKLCIKTVGENYTWICGQFQNQKEFPDVEAKANAAFIVQACNSYEPNQQAIKELVEGLRDFAKEADEWTDSISDDLVPKLEADGTEFKFSVGDLRRARALIAKHEVK